ncbi:MAG: hypothetical protein ACRECC_12265 [Pseudolabrys sp.]
MKPSSASAGVLATIILASVASHAHATTCTQITTAAQLQAMQSNLAGDYCLANDIDLSSIANFVPVGDLAQPFTGHFDGKNHIISNLTAKSPTLGYIGLFGYAAGATLNNVTIRNATVAATPGNLAVIGILAGEVDGPNSAISHVKTAGKVTCTANCTAGGLIGTISGTMTVSHSSSAADISAPANQNLAGGLVAFVEDSTSVVTRSYATGNVNCGGDACYAGGLVGNDNGVVAFSFATGSVVSSGSDFNFAGGLIGYDSNTGAGPTHQSFALGRVFTASGIHGAAGGLAGQSFASTTDQTYAAGSVGSSGGAAAGGLIGSQLTGSTVTNSYWDAQTSGQTTSIGGVRRTTGQLRAHLSPGFGNSWSIATMRSFPFLTDPQIDFNAPLATLVHNNTLFTFLPIGQLDPSNYVGSPTHTDQASLATVYTMIARAVSISDDVASLANVKINKYFWRDHTEKTTYAGPVKAHATLGTLATIPAATPLGRANVVGQLNAGRLVILRGTYKTGKTTTATHYMLGTMYVPGAKSRVIADDPYTGRQVYIDVTTKTVVSPARFPLAHFMVDGYQPVTLQ